MARIIHCIWPVVKGGSIAHRQSLFLQSVDRALIPGVHLVAVSDSWSRPGWEIRPPRRNASAVGDTPLKPFLKDLYDQALELANPEDWLLCGNVDCCFTSDFYSDLLSRRATAVEYMRHDVVGDPANLAELDTFPREEYPAGLDAFAIRAGFYRDIQQNFPDFVLGEPHWDTALSGILRNMVPVQRDDTRLLHPKHEQVWDLGHLTPAGLHNNRIYVDSLTFGFCKEHIIGPVSPHPDTAVIVTVFGESGARLQANIDAIRLQLEQDLWSDCYLVELRPGGVASLYPDDILSRVHHVLVECPPEAEDIFHKEALFNIGWKTARERHSYDYWIFLDADVHCDQPDWLRRIRARLQENPARAVQGFGTVIDPVDPDFRWCSLASAFQLSRQTDLPLNPGICWGLHRELIGAAGGFNPFSLGGAGDSLFVAELLNRPEMPYDPWLHQFSWYRDVFRDLPFRAEFDCVAVEVIHHFHGPMSRRNYDGVRYAMSGLRPVREWLEVSPAGLTVWKDPEGIERKVCRRREEMVDRDAADRIFEEMGIERQSSDLAESVLREKPVFSVPGYRAPRTIVSSSIPHVETSGPRRLNLFNPVTLYRDDFPFSWCGNVLGPESRRIPTQIRDGVPCLILEHVPGTPWISGILPVETNWQPLDLREYSTLHFTVVYATRDDYFRVDLVMQLPDGTEQDSRAVRLADLGWEAGREMEFSVPLEAFVAPGQDLRHVRLVRWSGGGNLSFGLSKIYIV